MLHCLYSDEAFLNGEPWYCRVGVAVRPFPFGLESASCGDLSRTDEVRSAIRDLWRRAHSISPLKDMGEFSGTKILRARAQALSSNDTALVTAIDDLASRLCAFVGDKVDTLVVEGRIDRHFDSVVALDGMNRSSQGKNAIAIETSQRLISQAPALLTFWCHQNRRDSQNLAILPCFDNVVDQSGLQNAIECKSQFLSYWLRTNRHYIARAVFVPSHFEPLLQQAEVYAAFIHEEREGRFSTYAESIRSAFNAAYPAQLHSVFWQVIPHISPS